MSLKGKMLNKFFTREASKTKPVASKYPNNDKEFFNSKKNNPAEPRVINRYEITLDDEAYFNEMPRENNNYQSQAPKTKIYRNSNHINDNKYFYNNEMNNTITTYGLQKPLLESENDNYLDDNYSPTSYQKPEWINNEFSNSPKNFAYQQLNNQVIPKEITNEVRSEKYRLVLTLIIGLAGVITTAIPLVLWILKQQDMVIDMDDLIPHPFLMVPLCIFSLGLFFHAFFDLIKIKREVDRYLKNARLGNNVIPNFIIVNYKKMHVRSIVINWIAFPSYIIGALIISILYGLSLANRPRILYYIILNVQIRDLTIEIIILTAMIFGVFFLQVLNIIFVKKRKANIIGFYGYEIINSQEMQAIKKRTNRLCFWTWVIILAIIFFIIAIPILIVRRRRSRAV